MHLKMLINVIYLRSILVSIVRKRNEFELPAATLSWS
jgi:hypothetical protein